MLRKDLGTQTKRFLPPSCSAASLIGVAHSGAGAQTYAGAHILVLRLVRSLNVGLGPGCWSLISELCSRLCCWIPLWVSAGPSISWASLPFPQKRNYSTKNSLFFQGGALCDSSVKHRFLPVPPSEIQRRCDSPSMPMCRSRQGHVTAGTQRMPCAWVCAHPTP